MTVSADHLRRLVALGLPADAMGEVLSIIAEVSERSGSNTPGAIRTRRWREKRASPGDVTVTSQNVTKASQNVTHAGARAEPKITNSSSTHSEIKEEEKQETRASALVVVEFEETFWPRWQNKVGKAAAKKAWPKALRAAGSVAAIMAGVEAYIAHKPPDQNWMNPATFLNGERWNDRPAATGPPAERPQQSRNGYAAIKRRLNEHLNGPHPGHPPEPQHSGPTLDLGPATLSEPTVSRPPFKAAQSGADWPTRQ